MRTPVTKHRIPHFFVRRLQLRGNTRRVIYLHSFLTSIREMRQEKRLFLACDSRDRHLYTSDSNRLHCHRSPKNTCDRPVTPVTARGVRFYLGPKTMLLIFSNINLRCHNSTPRPVTHL